MAKLPRRQFLQVAAGVAVAPAFPSFASAFDYPTRPVHVLVGFAAGGPLDTGARIVAQALSERLGQQFLVENLPGASSNLAAEQVVRAHPDGYTLLIGSSANAWNQTLYGNLTFNFTRDLAPVASYAHVPGVMEVNPAVPVKSVSDFIAYAKANPGKINMASAGPGSIPGMFGELFKAMTGVDLVTVNYRGSAPALPDLLSGRMQVMFDVVSSSIGHIRAGKLRALGVTTATRLSVLPDVPPIGETVPKYEGVGWNGVCAPRNTPREIVNILNRELNASLAEPQVRARLSELGYAVFASSPVEFEDFIKQYTEKWARVIRAAGIKAQ